MGEDTKGLKAYLITSPNYYPPECKTFGHVFERALRMYCPQYALLRGYAESKDYKPIAHRFVALCKEFGCLPFVSADIALAQSLQIGIHLRANQANYITSVVQSLQVFYSAHNLAEMLYAEQQGVHAMTISPIFHTPNKPPPLGITTLKKIMSSQSFHAEIFALGGIISKQQLESLIDCGLTGFASIRYFIR